MQNLPEQLFFQECHNYPLQKKQSDVVVLYIAHSLTGSSQSKHIRISVSCLAQNVFSFFSDIFHCILSLGVGGTTWNIVQFTESKLKLCF